MRISDVKDLPLVSIIINNYNYERFLAKAIDSALAQTYSRTEIIVVDDGSTDSSHNLITRYGDRIIQIFQENGKQSAALNAGFTVSQGDIIFFLDADDYLYPTAVQQVIKAFQPEVGKVHFSLQVVDGDGQSLGYFIPSIGLKLSSGEVWRELLKTSSYVSSPMSGNAYRRNTLSSIFPIPQEYKTTGDDYLMISTPFYAGKLASVDGPLGAYRVHNSNQWALTTVSGSRFRRFVKHDLQNFSLLKQRAKEFGHEVPADLEKRSLGRIWSRLASLRLEPLEHPVASDKSSQLVYWGLTALWKYSSHNWKKRIIYSIWFLWVGYMPIYLSSLGISWLYAPHLRPKAINWSLTKIRALVS